MENTEPEPAPDAGDDVHRNVLAWVNRLNPAPQRPQVEIPPRLTAAPNPTYAADEQEPPATQPVPEPDPPASPPASQPAPDPPALGRVSVRAAPDALSTAGEPSGPAVNAPAFARGGAESLLDLLNRLPPASDNSFREQLDRRMLWVIAGDYEHARAPLHLVTAEQQELATRFVEAWISIRDWHMGDQAGAAAAAAKELEELHRAVQRLCELNIPVLEICSAVRGYGQYDVLDPAQFPAGTASEFVLYCEVSAFVSDPDNDGYYASNFEMRTAILNRAGDTVLELKDTNVVDRCRNRRRDCFIPRLVRLPATLSPGNYVAKVTVIDKLGQKVAEDRVTFSLSARQ